MAEEDKGAMQKTGEKLEKEMEEKSPMQAVKDDLTGGGGSEGKNPVEGEPIEESKGQASGTPGGPGVYKEENPESSA